MMANPLKIFGALNALAKRYANSGHDEMKLRDWEMGGQKFPVEMLREERYSPSSASEYRDLQRVLMDLLGSSSEIRSLGESTPNRMLNELADLRDEGVDLSTPPGEPLFGSKLTIPNQGSMDRYQKSSPNQYPISSQEYYRLLDRMGAPLRLLDTDIPDYMLGEE